jgi:hypothetical protein
VPWDVDGLPEEPDAAPRRFALDVHSRGPGEPNLRGCDRSSVMRLSRSKDSNRIRRSLAHSSSKFCDDGWDPLSDWLGGGPWPAIVVVGRWNETPLEPGDEELVLSLVLP